MIRDSFWTDAYVEKLTPDEKLLFLYLLTNPLCNIGGIYEIRTKRIGFETGYDTEVVENILGRFERDKKILRHDDWIVLVNHIKNQSLNPSVIQGCQRIFDELPPEIKLRVTGWVQAGLLNLTLLNLTILNSTLPKKAVDKKSSLNEKSVTVADMSKYNLLGAEIIKGFELVDPKNKTYYSNTTQRGACDFLIEEYGLQEVLTRILVLPKSNGTPYFPTITTPVQLRDKWVQLEKAVERTFKEKGVNKVAF